jgi:hypothetical protein
MNEQGITLQELFVGPIAAFGKTNSDRTIALVIKETELVNTRTRVWFRADDGYRTICTLGEFQGIAKLAEAMARWLQLLGLVGAPAPREPPSFLLTSDQVAALAEGVRRNTIARLKTAVYDLAQTHQVGEGYAKAEIIEMLDNYLERRDV